MNARDLFNNLQVSLALPPKAAVTNDTPFVSEIYDCALGECPLFVGIHGTNADADATYAVLVEDGDDSALADNAAVDDAYLQGVEAMGLDKSKDNKTFKIGYFGPKRYVRVTITPANNTGNAFIAGVWITGCSRVKPKATQIN